jgi:hypothetical protein
MEKVYIVLWRGKYEREWACDGIFRSFEIAEAKMRFESLQHPEWAHAILTGEIPTEAVSA